MILQSWAEVTSTNLQRVWAGVLETLPLIIGAIVVIIVGLVVASLIKWLVESLIKGIKLDVLLEKLGLTTYLSRAGLNLDSGRFFGLLVYWFLVIVFVLAASDILHLWGLSIFLSNVLAYVPNVIAAMLMILAAVVAAKFLKSLVGASIMSAKLHASRFLGTFTWWAVVIFGLLAALYQLLGNSATTLINTLVTGVIAMIALAGGIAFGLGGKEYAAHLLEKLREHTEEE
ncbi:hypothetical protein HYV91_02525 [Candidatus Wolfebacteria bacterium]|nr:hypothetical protein [Candidatus Wolfebacteria bacterium]